MGAKGSKKALNLCILWLTLLVAYTYLLLAEFLVCTVNYGPSFFPSIWKKTRIHNLQYGPKKRA